MSNMNDPVVKIGDRYVGGDNPTFIIAEAGINHCGSLDEAKFLISESKRVGADSVKFQKRTINRILTKEGLNKPYINNNSFGETYGKHKEYLEFNEEQYRELKNYADEIGILFGVSVWDEDAADFIDKLDVPYFKMASADLTNFNLLRHVAKKGKPMIMSTGMANLDTVIKAYNIVKEYNDLIIIMHCCSAYPTQASDVNLNVLHTYSQTFPNSPIAFSNHTVSISTPFAAVVLGSPNKLLNKRNCCSAIEIHVVRSRAGVIINNETKTTSDSASSYEFVGVQKIVRDIREFEITRGEYEKTFRDSEIKCFNKLAKSIVSNCFIKKGTVITQDMITTKGPMHDDYISAMYFDDVIGKIAQIDIDEDLNINKSWINF